MKTQSVNNKLRFEKNSLTELNHADMNSINGGGSTIVGGETCSGCVCVPVLTKLTVVRPQLQ